MGVLRIGERESQVLADPIPSMSNAVGSLRSQIALSPRNVKVALVDVALIAVFVLVGEVNHGISPLESPLRVLGTFAPFLVGWVVSVLLGTYRSRAFRSAKAAASVAGAAWISAALLGQLLRGTALFHGDLTLAFTIVSILVGLALLVPWRVLVAVRRG